MSQNAPSDAGQLIGERNRQHVGMQPLLGRLDPGFEPVALPALRLDQHNPRRLHEQDAQIAIAALGYLAQDRAASGRHLSRTRPNQAPKSRPLENASPVPIAATIALEMIGPIPGTLISRSQPASWRAIVSISPDKPSIRSLSRRQSPARSSIRRAIRNTKISRAQTLFHLPGPLNQRIILK